MEFNFGIVGISGYAGAGKDTAGMALYPLGYDHCSFADPLRESCSLVTGVPLEVFNNPETKNVPRDDLYGKTPREVLQLIGTEGWRNLIHPDVWVNAFIRRTGKKYSADVRFINEAKAIKDAGGILIHIEKPGQDKPEFQHQSEMEIAEVKKMAHIVIINDGTVEQLQNIVHSLFNSDPLLSNLLKTIEVNGQAIIINDTVSFSILTPNRKTT